MESVLRDVRLALRRLRMAPGFTLFAIVSLALGIGVSTAVYSAVHTLFWLPLGVPHQDELVAISASSSSTGCGRWRRGSSSGWSSASARGSRSVHGS